MRYRVWTVGLFVALVTAVVLISVAAAQGQTGDLPHPAQCFTHGTTAAGHGSITNDGTAVTLDPFDQAWFGDHWESLTINDAVGFDHPDSGVPYFAPEGALVETWIVCKGETPSDTTTTSESPAPSTTITPTSTSISTITTLSPPPLGGVPAGGGGCADRACDYQWWTDPVVRIMAGLVAGSMALLGVALWLWQDAQEDTDE